MPAEKQPTPKAQPLFVLPRIPWIVAQDPDSEASRRCKKAQDDRVASWRRTVDGYRRTQGQKTSEHLYWGYWLINCHPVFWWFESPHQHERNLVWNRGFALAVRFPPAGIIPIDMTAHGFGIEIGVMFDYCIAGNWNAIGNDQAYHGFDDAIIQLAAHLAKYYGFDRRKLAADYIRPPQ